MTVRVGDQHGRDRDWMPEFTPVCREHLGTYVAVPTV